TVTYDVTGGVGAQVGLGVFVVENSAIEFLVRSVGVNMTAKGTSASADYGYGSLVGLSVGWKHLF
ncbi:MAG: hypothetical protein J7501_11525, partial [Bdellovibrio sp.]|nr:hypothetical protein [Bdellovibrio sp.]